MKRVLWLAGAVLLILQAERQVAYLDGQLAEIVALLKRLRET